MLNHITNVDLDQPIFSLTKILQTKPEICESQAQLKQITNKIVQDNKRYYDQPYDNINHSIHHRIQLGFIAPEKPLTAYIEQYEQQALTGNDPYLNAQYNQYSLKKQCNPKITDIIHYNKHHELIVDARLYLQHLNTKVCLALAKSQQLWFYLIDSIDTKEIEHLYLITDTYFFHNPERFQAIYYQQAADYTYPNQDRFTLNDKQIQETPLAHNFILKKQRHPYLNKDNSYTYFQTEHQLNVEKDNRLKSMVYNPNVKTSELAGNDNNYVDGHYLNDDKGTYIQEITNLELMNLLNHYLTLEGLNKNLSTKVLFKIANIKQNNQYYSDIICNSKLIKQQLNLPQFKKQADFYYAQLIQKDFKMSLLDTNDEKIKQVRNVKNEKPLISIYQPQLTNNTCVKQPLKQTKFSQQLTKLNLQFVPAVYRKIIVNREVDHNKPAVKEPTFKGQSPFAATVLTSDTRILVGTQAKAISTKDYENMLIYQLDSYQQIMPNLKYNYQHEEKQLLAVEYPAFITINSFSFAQQKEMMIKAINQINQQAIKVNAPIISYQFEQAHYGNLNLTLANPIIDYQQLLDSTNYELSDTKEIPTVLKNYYLKHYHEYHINYKQKYIPVTIKNLPYYFNDEGDQHKRNSDFYQETDYHDITSAHNFDLSYDNYLDLELFSITVNPPTNNSIKNVNQQLLAKHDPDFISYLIS